MMPDVKVPVGYIRRSWRRLMDVFDQLYGTIDENVQGRSFDILVEAAARELGLKDQPVREALASYYGRIITPEMLRSIAFKLAGGRARMLENKPLSSQLKVGPAPVWLAVFVADCDLLPSYRGGDPRLHVDLIVASGEFSGVRIQLEAPHKYWIKLLPEVLGFPKWGSIHEKELVQLYFMGSFDLSDPKRIRILETGATSNMKSTNSKIRLKRNSKCVEGYSQLCHRCWLGYSGANRCSRACRELTLVKSFCRKCGESSFFKPGTEHKECVTCINRATKAYRQRIAM